MVKEQEENHRRFRRYGCIISVVIESGRDEINMSTMIWGTSPQT